LAENGEMASMPSSQLATLEYQEERLLLEGGNLVTLMGYYIVFYEVASNLHDL
jgi:hypothetical protein